MSGEGTHLNFQQVVNNANSNFAFGWEEVTPLAPTQATPKNQEIPFPCSKLFVYSDYEIYFTWSNNTTDTVNTTNSLKLPANTLVQMNVPWGKPLEKNSEGSRQPSESVYFHCRTVSNNTASVRIVRG